MKKKKKKKMCFYIIEQEGLYKARSTPASFPPITVKWAFACVSVREIKGCSVLRIFSK